MIAQPPAPDDVAVLARQAGLALKPKHFEQLVDAYGYVHEMLQRLHRGRPRADEPGHIFAPSRFDGGER